MESLLIEPGTVNVVIDEHLSAVGHGKPLKWFPQQIELFNYQPKVK